MTVQNFRNRTRYERFASSELGELAPGGEILQLTASGTLLVGDVVYYSAARTVAKSASVANHDKVAGVVVGGQSSYGAIFGDEESLVGQTAATDGQYVYVLVRGLAYVTGAAAIAAGVALVADTATAGRVKAATDFAVSAPTSGTLAASVDAGATPVTSTAANGAIITLSGSLGGGVLSGEGNARVIGRAIDACSGAADTFLAWINIH